MKPLASGYRIAHDNPGVAWNGIIAEFRDASPYQLWSDTRSCEHLVLERDGEAVAVSEIRLFTVPVVNIGIAYVFWGPLWKRWRRDPDLEDFRQAVRALVNTFVEERGLILRLNPRLLVEHDRSCLEVLESEGFSRFGSRPARRSLIVDLTPDLDEIRKRLDKKWRNCLSKAERSDLEIVSGTEPDLFDEFLPVYQSMLRRKQLKPEADLRVHRNVQRRLPEHLKMRVVLARHGGRACAGAIYSPIGDTAIYLFGATDGAGMQTCASYAVQWTIVGELKGRNIQAYDLNGTNAELNPGTYHFKKGLAGRFTEEVTFAPQVQMHRATMANRVILGIDRMRARVRSTRPPAAARRIGETSTEPAVNR